jgi:hypothetical protein
MSPDQIIQPVCPHCFYSFDGLTPDNRGRATCPECGVYTGPINAANSGILDRSAARQKLKDFLLMCLGILILLIFFGAIFMLIVALGF